VKCDGYRILIREMLQGKLDVEEATVVASHMDVCADCSAFHRETVASRTVSGDHVDEMPSAPEKPPVARHDALPAVIAIILAALFLGGLALIATHAGWFRSGRSSCNTGHHSIVHGRSR